MSIAQQLLDLLSALNKGIYTYGEILELSGLKSNMLRKTLYILVRKERLIRLAKEIYLFSPEGYGKNWTAESFYISSFLTKPYAISFWSASHYYGWTEQIPKTVFIQTTQKTNHSVKNIMGVQYRIIRVKKEYFSELKTVWVNNKTIVVTNEEKTIIDMFNYLKYSGGFVEAVKSLAKYFEEKRDCGIFIEVLLKFGKLNTIKRIGYLVEYLNLPLTKGQVGKIRCRINNTPIALDPTHEDKKKFDKKWRLLVNVELYPFMNRRRHSSD